MDFPAYVPSVALSVRGRPSSFVHSVHCRSIGSTLPRPCGSFVSPCVLRRSSRHASDEKSLRMHVVSEQKLLDIRAKEVFMPALSSTMTEGVVVAWLKQPGDYVKAGENIMTIESDKADMDVESFESGYLATILVEEGGKANVGETLALIAESKEDLLKVQECGTECIISGSGNRHDGTTAVESRSVQDSKSRGNSKDEPLSTADVSDSNDILAKPVSSGELVPKPDLIDVWMPALSSTMEKGKIDSYYVKVGDTVKEGDIIMAVESDKASMDVEAFDSGIFAHVVVDVGEECKINEPVAYLAKTEADIPRIQAWAKTQAASFTATSTGEAKPVSEKVAKATSTAVKPQASQNGAALGQEGPVIHTGRVIATPFAKKRAKELGVDLTRVRGTGPNGRIAEADVLSAHSARASAEPATDTIGVTQRSDGKVIATPEAKKLAKQEKIEISTLRGTGNFGRVTATDVLKAAGKFVEETNASSTEGVTSVKSPAATPSGKREVAAMVPEGAVTMTSAQKAVVRTMNASLTVPVFRVEYSIKTTAFDDLYAKVKSKNVTVSALLAKAVAITLGKHPIMNAAYGNDSVIYRPEINIAMAVSLPDGGLMTPVLKDSDKLDLYMLSRNWKDLVKRTMSKSLKPAENSGGTFYISNLGMYGVDSFDAILPPGAPCILAVAASKPVVAVQSNGLVGAHKEMKVNITCDHRHIYGANAAEFLRDLADLIENNVTNLLL